MYLVFSLFLISCICIKLGFIFLDFLKRNYGIKEDIQITFNIENLIDVSSYFNYSSKKNNSSSSNDVVDMKENVIQDISYFLLTIYSSDSRNYDILEKDYYFLSLLLLSIPALHGWEALSAVLTTLNYVCQCIDVASDLPIIALCATATIITKNALKRTNNKSNQNGIDTGKNDNNELVRNEYILQLDTIFSSFESIIRGQNKYATVIMQSNILQYILCNPLEELLISISNDQMIDMSTISVYIKVINFIISIQKKSNTNISTIHSSEILLIVKRLIVSTSVPILLIKNLLLLVESLACSYKDLKDVMACLFSLLDTVLMESISLTSTTLSSVFSNDSYFPAPSSTCSQLTSSTVTNKNRFPSNSNNNDSNTNSRSNASHHSGYTVGGSIGSRIGNHLRNNDKNAEKDNVKNNEKNVNEKNSSQNITEIDKIACICDAISSLMYSNNEGILVWNKLKGFNTFISLVNKIGTADINTKASKIIENNSNKEDVILAILRSLLDCITTDLYLTTTVENNNIKNPLITLSHVHDKYAILSDTLLSQLILTTSYAERALFVIFGLIRGPIGLSEKGAFRVGTSKVLAGTATGLSEGASILFYRSDYFAVSKMLNPSASAIIVEMLLKVDER